MSFWSSLGTVSAAVADATKNIRNDVDLNAAVNQAFSAADHPFVEPHNEKPLNPKVKDMDQQALHPVVSASWTRSMPAVQQEQHAQLTVVLKKAGMWKLEGKNGWYAFTPEKGLRGKVWVGVIPDVTYQDAIKRIAAWNAKPSLPGVTWRLPTYHDLNDYAHHSACPHRQGKPYHLDGKDFFGLKIRNM